MARQVDYDAVIAALHAEKAEQDAQYEAAIEMMKALKARQATSSSQLGAGSQVNLQASRSTAGRYRGMTITKAAEEHLDSVGHGQTTREITDALIAGGAKTRAEIVYNSMYAAKKTFRRDDDKWVLTKWSRQIEVADGSVASAR